MFVVKAAAVVFWKRCYDFLHCCPGCLPKQRKQTYKRIKDKLCRSFPCQSLGNATTEIVVPISSQKKNRKITPTTLVHFIGRTILVDRTKTADISRDWIRTVSSLSNMELASEKSEKEKSMHSIITRAHACVCTRAYVHTHACASARTHTRWMGQLLLQIKSFVHTLAFHCI